MPPVSPGGIRPGKIEIKAKYGREFEMLDYIARPLGIFLKFIYDTIAFQNYGLAIIVFTIIVRAAMLPLTLKQYKSTSKMQEIQPLINDIQKRYKDDKEKLNQELMKLYQEHNYNPMGGCFPMLIQMPIILSLYWVIVQPLKFMLGKDELTQIPKIIDVASQALGKTVQQMGSQKELLAMSYFNENPDALSKVTGLLDKSELIDFNNFLGLHLGEIPTYKPELLFGSEAGIYIPLVILVILATVTTFFSTKLSMPKTKPDAQKGGAAGCSNNTMMYMGPAMTLYFGFMMPAGVILYWMIGYVVGIFQQLYINNHIKKVKSAPVKTADSKLAEGNVNALEAGAGEGEGDAAAGAGEGATGGTAGGTTGGASGKQPQSGSRKPKNSSGSGQKGGQKGGKKGGKKK